MAKQAAPAVPRKDATAAAPRVRGGLPNGLTLACLGLGFLAALAAGKGDPDQAARMLALAAMADLLAGWAAQSLRQNTLIGAELDSLAALIVWGIAGSLLAYEQGLRPLGAVGTALAGLVAVSAAWRLCRGDGQNGRERYEGLPLPAAGAAMTAAAMAEAPAAALAGLAALLVVAMVGPWSYPRPKPGLARLLPILVSLGLAAFGWKQGWYLPGAAALVYALLAPVYARFHGKGRTVVGSR